jgi:hypothetical protein
VQQLKAGAQLPSDPQPLRFISLTLQVQAQHQKGQSLVAQLHSDISKVCSWFHLCFFQNTMPTCTRFFETDTHAGCVSAVTPTAHRHVRRLLCQVNSNCMVISATAEI